MPDESVHTIVTSPPYWGLRDYGVTDQLGLEPTPWLYLEHMVELFAECRRVLRSDGTLWLNMGDSYHNGDKGGYLRTTTGKQATSRGTVKGLTPNRVWQSGLKPKDMVGMPWRLAFALQDDGWYLRQEIIWSKTNSMPESVEDRCTKSHEQIFLLTKAKRYFFDGEAIKETSSINSHSRGDGVNPKARTIGHNSRMLRDQDPRHLNAHNEQSVDHRKHGFNERWKVKQNASFSAAVRSLTSHRQARSVWTMPKQAMGIEMCGGCKTVYLAVEYRRLRKHKLEDGYHRICRCGRWDTWISHFATFPEELPRRCILAGTSEHGCCAKCGAPWERILKPTAEYAANLGKGKRMNGCDYQYDEANGMRIREKVDADYVTVGWQPTCKCGEPECRPAVVLDPFSGAGTVGKVALRLGRGYLGFELNPNYVILQRYRIVQDNPLFNTMGESLAGALAQETKELAEEAGA